MKRSSKRTIFIGLICVSAVTFAFAIQRPGAANPPEVKIGAFVPLSGINADTGGQMKAGIEVAIERAKKDGIRLGGNVANLRVVWYDTEMKPDVALNVVTRALTVDKIDVGVGFVASDVFIRVMDEFQKRSVPVITCCAASVIIGDRIAQNKMTYVFQLSPTANDIVPSLAAAVAAHVKPKKVVMLNENTDAGRAYSKSARDWFAAHAKHVEIVADEYVERGVSDLTPQLTKIKRLGAEAIIGEIYGPSATVLFNQWAELRVPAVIAHMGGTVSTDVFIEKNQKVVEGALVNNRWWPAKYSEISEPVMNAYKSKMKADPPSWAIQAHDAAAVAIDAIRGAGSVEPERIRSRLESETFVMAWGVQKFKPLVDGHRMPKDMVIVQIQGGKKVPVYPPSVASMAGGKYVPAPPFAWDRK